jgi:transglutaminase-like putative cysteine protease
VQLVRRLLWALCGLCLALGGTHDARANGRAFDVGAVPGWVIPVEVDLQAVAPPDQVSGGSHHLLVDHQVRVTDGGRISYRHLATRSLSPSGVESNANIEIRFDPAYQRLTLHTINVLREGRVIPKLDASAVRVLQREKELDALIFDGSQTAHVFLEDVRVGDVVEYAFSLRGSNPVFGGQHFGQFDLQWGVPVERAFARLVWPRARDLHLARNGSAGAPTVLQSGGELDHRWERRQVPARRVDDGAPAWFDPYAWVQWGDFKDWAAVQRWAVPLYRLPDRPAPEVKAAAERIAAAHASPAQRLRAALQLVQSEVRYLGVEIGASSHAPNPPQQVLQRRFGDCKDKTLLTVALLRALDIEAHPALVNTQVGKGIEWWRSSPGAFDHVLVKAVLGDKVYWLDPTRSPQAGDLDHVVQSDHGLALVVDGRADKLAAMAGDSARAQRREIDSEFDARAGFDAPTLFRVKTVAYGAAAESLRSALANQSREALQKSYLNYYAGYFDQITVGAPLEVSDDTETNRITVTEHYRIGAFWQRNEGLRRLEMTLRTPELGEYLKTPQTRVRNAPLALTHPVDLKQVTRVLLPEAWDLQPEEVHIQEPEFEVHRSRVPDGRTLIVTDRFRSRLNVVQAENVEAYATRLEKARDDLGYMLYWYGQGAPSAAGDAPHWLGAVLGALSLVCFTALALRLYRWDPAARAAEPGSTAGLGGWLSLAALALGFTLLRLVQDFIKTWPSYGSLAWERLTNPGQPDYDAAWQPVLLFDRAAQVGLIVATVLVIVLFAQRRTSLPRAFVALFAAAWLVAAVDMALAPAAAEASGAASLLDLGRAGVVALAWGLYFQRSQRVRATFVRRLADRATAPTKQAPEPSLTLRPAAPVGPEAGV